MDGRGRQTGHAFFKHKAANRTDLAALGHLFGPDHKHVGNRAVGDPHLAARELVAAGHLVGAGGHGVGVRTVVWLGQAKAADPRAGGQLGQVFLALPFGTKLKNGQHHQRTLHAHHGAVAGIDPLHLTGDQAVGYVVQARATIGFGDGGAEQAELAHLAEDAHVSFFGAKGLGYARKQLVLAVGGGGIAQHALLVAELALQQKRVLPVERSVGHKQSFGLGRK